MKFQAEEKIMAQALARPNDRYHHHREKENHAASRSGSTAGWAIFSAVSWPQVRFANLLTEFTFHLKEVYVDVCSPTGDRSDERRAQYLNYPEGA
jgi:hypothetical protein